MSVSHPYGEESSAAQGLPIRIGDRHFATDFQAIASAFLPANSNTFDISREPTERSLGDRSIWKRSRHDFSHGMGQDILDDEDVSDPRRFRWCYNLDTWNPRGVTLQRYTRGNVFPVSDVAGDRAFFVRTSYTDVKFIFGAGERVAKYELSDEDWSRLGSYVANKSGDTLLSLTIIGARLVSHWLLAGTESLELDPDSGTYDSIGSPITSTTLYQGGVWAANDRLLALHASEIRELDATLTETATLGAVSFGERWSMATSGPRGPLVVLDEPIQDTSSVWLIALDTSTGGLVEPVQVAQMPRGERIYDITMSAESGLILLGTSKGVRLAVMSDGGELQYGSLIDVGAVRSVHTDGRWGYFTVQDSSSPDGSIRRQGVARMDLSTLLPNAGSLVPAWALWATRPYDANRTMQAVFTDPNGDMLWASTGVDDGGPEQEGLSADGGVYLVQLRAEPVPEGEMWSGSISYDVSDPKRVVDVAAKWASLIGPAVSVDQFESVEMELRDVTKGTIVSAFIADGEGVTTGSGAPTQALVAETLEVITILRGLTVDRVFSPWASSSSPTFERWTLRAVPVPFRPQVFQVPVINDETVMTGDYESVEVTQSVIENFLYLSHLVQERTIVEVEIGSHGLLCYVDDLAVSPTNAGIGGTSLSTDPMDAFVTGTWVVTLVTVADTGLPLAIG